MEASRQRTTRSSSRRKRLTFRFEGGAAERALRVSGDENLKMIEETVAFLVGEGRRVLLDAEHFFDGYNFDSEYAIKALLELRAKDALPSLTRMLGDNRSEHRISALWLIDELGILQLARLVAEISLNDSDDKVKQRASRVIQHLIEDLDHAAHKHDANAAAQPTEVA